MAATVALEVLVAVCVSLAMLHDTYRWTDVATAVPLVSATGTFMWLTRHREAHWSPVERTSDYTLVWAVVAAILLPVAYVVCLTVAIVAFRRATTRTPANLAFATWVYLGAALGVNAMATATPLRGWLMGEAAFDHQTASVLTMMAAWSGVILSYVAAQLVVIMGRGVLARVRTGSTATGRAHRPWMPFAGGRRDYHNLAKTLALASLGAAAIGVNPLLAVAAVLPVAVHLTRVERDCETDSLTGVRTKRAITHEGQHVVALDSAIGRPSSVLMCDVDCFKMWNGRYGHPACDRLLRAVASAMRATVREDDLIGRWGGEEILIVLPGTDSTTAAEIGQRLLRAVANIRIDLSDRGSSHPLLVGVGDVPRCTVSIGVASTPEHGITYSALERAADDAVLEAKARGRNRLVVSGPRGASVREPASERSWMLVRQACIGKLWPSRPK